jgi:hypothetical protein
MQPYVMALYLPESYQFSLGFSWQLVIATSIATLVCLIGNNNALNMNHMISKEQ